MGPLSAFTHSRHTSVDPANKGIVWGPACRCTTPIVACIRRDSSFRNHNALWGEVIGLTPNPQPGGPGFFCRGFPSLSHRFRLFEGAEHSPFATVAQLLATASITRGYENEDVRHMTSLAEPILDGKAFLSIYGESIGDPCKPHREPLIRILRNLARKYFRK